MNENAAPTHTYINVRVYACMRYTHRVIYVYMYVLWSKQ